MESISGVYSIRNIKTDKRYIGCSKSIKRRWTEHKRRLLLNNHDNAHLQGAYNKYGPEMFEYSILEECPEDIMQEREEYWIAYYDSKNNGYNMCDGGGKLSNPTADVRKKISEGLKGENSGWYGISRCGIENNMYGRHHTEEAKRKMSEYRKTRVGALASRSKRVMASTGEKFINSTEAIKWVGLRDVSSIVKVCRGQAKTAGKHPVTKEPLGWKYY